jgi:hypothetical protein
MCLEWGLGRRWAFVEDDTMDRSEPREAIDASAPEQPALPPRWQAAYDQIVQ